ncbi:hypothetical protein M2140_001567 [Clostridiales Family XIII bacterium PM5-7]
MNRSDGYRVSGCDPMYEITPHFMPHRYDATNYIDLDLDLEAIQAYVNRCRAKGVKMKHMSVVIAAYLRLVSQNPHLNRFVVNKRIYARNHFCVSFVTLKSDSNGGEETVVKLYFNLDDDIFEVNRKVSEAIAINRTAEGNNSMDKVLRKIMRVPALVSGVVNVLRWWDKHFSLPFIIVDASPFHSSFFITNLASIRLNAVYHHIYDFGTTGIFIAMGQTEKRLAKIGEVVEEKKVLPIKVTTDERIESGYYFGRCFKEFKRYINAPETLEEKPDSVVKDANIKKKNPKFIVK